MQKKSGLAGHKKKKKKDLKLKNFKGSRDNLTNIHFSLRILLVAPLFRVAMYYGDLGINSKTPNRILTRQLPDTKCINASPRIRLHASIQLKSGKRKIIKCKVANGKWSRQN